MTTIERLKNNVILLRTSKGWNQKRLAEKANLGTATISLIEAAAKPKIAVVTVEKLAEAFGVTLMELLYSEMKLTSSVKYRSAWESQSE